MPIKVLIIDDNWSELESIVELLTENDYTVKFNDFENMEETLNEVDPEILILDYKKGDELAGNYWIDYVWSRKFIPIVFHSAFYEDLKSELSTTYQDHPLIKILSKGPKSFENLKKISDEFTQIISVIKEMDKKIFAIKQDTMKETLKLFDVNKFGETPSKFIDILSRRVGNYLENQNVGVIEPVEMFVFPPVVEGILSGDILLDRQNSIFLIVLTPSCDLRKPKNREKNSEHELMVHVALIESGSYIFSTLNKEIKYYSSGDKREIRDQIKGALNQGYLNEFFPLPPLKGYFDGTVVVNLKKCYYIGFSEIQYANEDNKRFERIASLDSPFRETLIWAYMSNACRPGLPNRDTILWSRMIIEEFIPNNASD